MIYDLISLIMIDREIVIFPLEFDTFHTLLSLSHINMVWKMRTKEFILFFFVFFYFHVLLWIILFGRRIHHQRYLKDNDPFSLFISAKVHFFEDSLIHPYVTYIDPVGCLHNISELKRVWGFRFNSPLDFLRMGIQIIVLMLLSLLIFK